MIGEEYFILRSRLKEDLTSLCDCQRKMAGSVDDIQILENLITSLSDPFVFVVVGEVNVGKSTFLNALFGADFSRTGVTPTTDKIFFFKHGPEVETRSISHVIDEVRVPCEFLKDFHIVDTPGTNSIEAEHQQITERFVPMADLVIFSFSAMNPWGASAWQFLDRVHRQWMRNVVFVLQQCDLRSPEEIQVITDYMGQLCKQRFGREFPLFTVSAKKAFLARSSGLDRERLLEESGFHPLEKHINSTVTESSTRLTKIQSALQIARNMLDKLIAQNEEENSKILQQRKLLAEMQTERDLQVERTKSKFAPALEASDRDFRDAAIRVISFTQDSFSVQKSFAAIPEDNRLPKNLDHRLYQDLLASAGERWQQVSLILQDDFKRFEEYITQRWLGASSLESIMRDSDGDHASDAARQRFTARVDSTLRRFVLRLQINEVLEPGLVNSRTQAKRFWWIVLGLVLIAGTLGFYLGIKSFWMGLAAVVLGAVMLLLFLRYTLRRSLMELAGQFDAARSQMKLMLKEQTTQDADTAFGIFTRIIDPERDRLDHSEVSIQQQLAQLFKLRSSMIELSDLLGKKAIR
jgi:GTPase Era involved in 16S rRNA processing